jgi:hypothetical protein
MQRVVEDLERPQGDVPERGGVRLVGKGVHDGSLVSLVNLVPFYVFNVFI